MLHEDLIARRIGEVGRGLYCSPDYIERHGAPQTPDDLVRHALIGHQAARNLNQIRLAIDGAVVTRSLTTRYSANTTSVIAQMVLLGLGIGNLNRRLMQPLVDAGRLVEVLVPWRDPTVYPVYVALQPDRQRLPRIEAVIEFLAEVMADAQAPSNMA